MNKKELHKIITFIEKAGMLESQLRFSETLKNWNESVADHSWRLALMTFLVDDELHLNLDVKHALKIAIVHDLAEALTGDIDAYHVITGRITKKEKERMEKAAIKNITRGFLFGEKIVKLWEEYLHQKTREAKFVKALDKLEAFLAVCEAGHKNYTQKIFYGSYADDAIKNFPELLPILTLVKKKLQKEMAKGKITWKE